MSIRELFPINIKKLKDKDRKFLLEKNSQEYLFNEQAKINNRTLLTSIFAVFVSVVSLVLLSDYNTNNQKLFVMIFIIVITTYLMVQFILSIININTQQRVIKEGYNELFKIHFNYAKQKKLDGMVSISSRSIFKDLLKWGNKWETGKILFILLFIFGLLLFVNRFNSISNFQDFDFCIKEQVEFWQNGNLQLLRSFFEHFIFNFIVPITFVILSLGFDKLFRQYLNWRVFFGIGAFCSVVITFTWEFQKMPVEWIEVIYDLLAVLLSYLFIRWMLKEINTNIKQKSKKENPQQ